jgi:hypothetical protein
MVVQAMKDARRKIEKTVDRKKKTKRGGEKEAWRGDGISFVPFHRGWAKILNPFRSSMNHHARFPRLQRVATVPLPQAVFASCRIQDA